MIPLSILFRNRMRTPGCQGISRIRFLSLVLGLLFHGFLAIAVKYCRLVDRFLKAGSFEKSKFDSLTFR